MKLCLAVALCENGFLWGGGGGGVAIVPYWIWKIVRPSEKILATPLRVEFILRIRTFSTVELKLGPDQQSTDLGVDSAYHFRSPL